MDWTVEYQGSETDAQPMLKAIEAALPPDANVKVLRLIEMEQEMFRFEDGVLEAGFDRNVPPPEVGELIGLLSMIL
jgi:hypothetical protein